MIRMLKKAILALFIGAVSVSTYSAAKLNNKNKINTCDLSSSSTGGSLYISDALKKVNVSELTCDYLDKITKKVDIWSKKEIYAEAADILLAEKNPEADPNFWRNLLKEIKKAGDKGAGQNVFRLWGNIGGPVNSIIVIMDSQVKCVFSFLD